MYIWYMSRKWRKRRKCYVPINNDTPITWGWTWYRNHKHLLYMINEMNTRVYGTHQLVPLYQLYHVILVNLQYNTRKHEFKEHLL